MIISPWDMKIQNFLMWLKNGLKAQKLLAQCCKKGRDIKSPARGSLLLFSCREFLSIIGLTCEAFA